MNLQLQKSLGFTDYDTPGRKNNEAVVEIRLEKKSVWSPYQSISHEQKPEGYETIKLTFSLTIWQPRKKDITAWYSGNGFSESGLFKHNKKFQRLCELAARWHLNAMKPGCEHQITGPCNNPTIMSQVCPESGYKYGSAWLFEEVPQEIVNEIIQDWS